MRFCGFAVTLRVQIITTFVVICWLTMSQHARADDPSNINTNLPELSGLKNKAASSWVIIASENLMSCAHVKARFIEYGSLLLQATEVLKQFADQRLSSIEALRSLESISRATQANSDKMFFRNIAIADIEISEPHNALLVASSTTSAVLSDFKAADNAQITDFRDGYTRIRIKINYLDMCLDQVVRIMPLTCNDKRCGMLSGFIINFAEIRNSWDKHVRGGN